MSDRFVTIRTLYDPLEAETLKALLEQEGIVATIQGAHHSALYGGLLASALRVPLQVRESDAERAREIIDALHDFDSADEEGHAPSAGDGPYRASAAPADEPPPRKVMVAVAAALVMPCVILLFGAGHFYVRSHLRGVALLLSAWTALLLFFRQDLGIALAALPVVMLLDAFGAARLIHGRR